MSNMNENTQLATSDPEKLVRADYEFTLTDVRAMTPMNMIALATMLSKAEGIGKGSRDDIAAKILTGALLGFEPIESVRGVDIIKGKPFIEYTLVLKRAKESQKYRYKIENHTDKGVTFIVRELIDGEWEEAGRIDYTMEMAVQAGYTSNPKYKTDPATMLLAKAVALGMRRYMPDLIGAQAYVSGEESEIQDAVFQEEPSMAEKAMAEASKAQEKPKRRTAKPETAPEPAPPATPEPEVVLEVVEAEAVELDPSEPEEPESSVLETEDPFEEIGQAVEANYVDTPGLSAPAPAMPHEKGGSVGVTFWLMPTQNEEGKDKLVMLFRVTNQPIGFVFTPEHREDAEKALSMADKAWALTDAELAAAAQSETGVKQKIVAGVLKYKTANGMIDPAAPPKAPVAAPASGGGAYDDVKAALGDQLETILKDAEANGLTEDELFGPVVETVAAQPTAEAKMQKAFINCRRIIREAAPKA